MPANPNRKLSRRQFTNLSCSTALAVASLPGPSSAADKNADWIDAHVHVWTADTQAYPLSDQFSVADMQPASFTAEELLAACRPEGVQRIVLIQMSFYGFDHRYMLDVMRAAPGKFAGVGLIDHRADDVVKRMEDLVEQGLRGFRLHSHGDAHQWVDQPGMALLWKRAGQSGWAVCPLINPQDIPAVDALCQRFPDTLVVVDHFARLGIDGHIRPEQLEALCRLARYPNVHVKTSAFYALGKKQAPYDDLQPMIRRVVDAFGPQRLMWASDCPFQVQPPHTYRASIALIRDRIDFLSTADKEWILRGTADKVFFS